MKSRWKTLSPIFYVTADFKKVVSDLFHTGSTLAESECIKKKTGPSEIVSKHRNSFQTFPYAINRNLAMYLSDFTCKYLVKSLKNQYELVPKEVKKTTESAKH